MLAMWFFYVVNKNQAVGDGCMETGKCSRVNKKPTVDSTQVCSISIPETRREPLQISLLYRAMERNQCGLCWTAKKGLSSVDNRWLFQVYISGRDSKIKISSDRYTKVRQGILGISDRCCTVWQWSPFNGKKLTMFAEERVERYNFKMAKNKRWGREVFVHSRESHQTARTEKKITSKKWTSYLRFTVPQPIVQSKLPLQHLFLEADEEKVTKVMDTKVFK